MADRVPRARPEQESAIAAEREGDEQPQRRIQAPAAEDALERTLATLVALGMPVLTVFGAIVALLIWGPGPMVLVLVAGALMGAIVLLWSSLRSLAGDAPIDPGFDEAVVRARATDVDERKRMVLRALKDLENERDLGKIDATDYEALASQYRARAKAILREMDDEIAPQREKAERIARTHLQKRGIMKAGYRDATPPQEDDDEDMVKEPVVARVMEARVSVRTLKVKCAKCGTSNDDDAAFCKKCGAKVSGADDDDESSDRAQEQEKEA